MTRKVTNEEIEAAMTPRGGWTRDTLAGWGVPWPPPKGWRKALIAGEEIIAPTVSSHGRPPELDGGAF